MKTLVIISNIKDPWGGSEELWFRSIPLFCKQGFKIHFIRKNPDFSHPKIKEMLAMGVSIHKLRKFKPPFIWRFISTKLTGEVSGEQFQLSLVLKAIRPNLVIVSQGINYDGLLYAKVCLDYHFPYVTIAQKAADINWPNGFERKFIANVQAQAKKSFFVSKSNLVQTEMHLGTRILNAELVKNPVDLQPYPVPFPSYDDGLKLLCLGRIFFIDKGQDMLLEVLAQEKWRERNLKVTIIGDGPNEFSLKQLIRLFNLTKVNHQNHALVDAALWANYHALVLPSRFEGRPLVVLEAMAAGRPCIATNAGGLSELLEDGVDSFLCEATVASIDSALERAWIHRNSLIDLGKNGFNKINQLYKSPAEHDFFQSVLSILD